MANDVTAASPRQPFSGRIRWVQIDLGGDAQDADHLIASEERLKLAMARQ
ncbi:MAG: hypothetical protein WD557_05935 [Dehalococcoidia bacterium]